MNKITAAITGIAGYVPEYILTNEELSKMVDTTDEWIMTRIGIKERHILREKGLGTSYMAEKAVRKLIAKTNINVDDVDLVVWCGVTPDMPFPSTANIVSDLVGIKHAFGFDINAGCSSFLFALSAVSKFIETGKYKKIILIGADKISSFVDYTDRATCPIFGDGAGAVLIEPNTEGYGLIDEILHVDGSGRKYLYQKAGGSSYPATMETVVNRQHFIYQEGQSVYKAAVSKMPETSLELMERYGLTPETIDWLIPHQANLRIIKAVGERMKLPKEKVMVNIEKYGNTTAATLPLCMWDFESKLKKGNKLILTTFGAGFSWGAIYLKWAYDGKEQAEKELSLAI
ncbi:MAG: ketoacyl-ACP synthase III [Prevotellaceae bacterium]|jgi:3-oxoacyl-[acyl-carrier-protein] synthase-3|nr:ketoacyl-ACP synthase III [Prevotellaceae bacterium]